MGFFNLLADLPITFLGQTFDISLNWIGRLINALIGGIGIVGVGIIVFSLILRCIVLPFDVFQRISMRKQNVKMKENKEKLDKLQRTASMGAQGVPSPFPRRPREGVPPHRQSRPAGKSSPVHLCLVE